jgi:diguanylate cyclase (GGDEF)-like protein
VAEVQATLTLAAGLGANLLRAPMGAVAVRDPEGRWINYLFGLNPAWEHRELPLAAEALAAGLIVVHSGPVPAMECVKFVAANPVNGAVLIVMDTVERQLTEEQHSLLSRVGTVVDAAVSLFREEDAFTRPSPIGKGEDHWSMRVDLSGRILRVDPRTEIRLGFTPGTLEGRKFAEIVEPSESTIAMDGLLAQLGAGGSLANNLRLMTATGDRVLVRAQTRLAFERGVPVGVDLVAHDFSSEAVRMEALRHAEQALSSKAEELARFSEHFRQLHRLATTEYGRLDEVLSDYLRSGCEILRMPVGAVTALSGSGAVLRAVYPPGADPGADSGVAIAHQRTFAYPFSLDNLEQPVALDAPFACYIGAPIYAGDELFGSLSFCSTQPGDVRRFSAHECEVLELMAKSLGRSIYEDQLRRERTRLTVELARQAQQDPLTGLANRMQFAKHLESALAKATQGAGTLAVAFLDLDRFKQVNDTLGHTTGDEVLRQVAARLQATAGPDQSVARVGGDEFTVLFAGNPTRGSVAGTAQRLLDAVRAPFPVAQTELFLTATLGISFFPDDGSEAGDLLQKADAAMYRAKGQGKNDYRFFTPDIILRSANRMELETQLRRALEKGELRMCFMPLVGADTGALESLEALLAWKNPRFGNVGPSRFIPIAEESGMIIPIGAWVLREVCRQGAVWQARNLPAIRVAINVSPLQFARPDFVEMVSNALRQSGLPPQCLEMELTESMIMRDVESAARRMAQLRDVGVSIAIDDFGTGYSSLSYLRRLPLDTLKIDQSFVAEIGADGTALSLIHTIVVLAHNIGLTVVAEGVETRKQLELLRAAGCDKVQGHVFGEPLTSGGVEELLRRPTRDVPLLR